jgi:hypothetical protein
VRIPLWPSGFQQVSNRVTTTPGRPETRVSRRPDFVRSRSRASGQLARETETGAAGNTQEAADALALALLIADEDARAGDLAQALNALDAAAAVGGGVLPEEAARKREAWRSRLATGPR